MPRHQRYWVGLDAGHLETAVCLVDAEGHAFFEAMTETRAAPIRDILRRFGVEPVQTVTIEAGVGTQMVRDLRSFGFPVQVVDVRKSSKFLAIRRHKTDANDARGLAELGRVAQSMGPQVFVKPVEHQDIRIMINIRRTLLKQRARTDALLQSIFRLHGANIKLLNGRGSLAAEVASQLRLLRTSGVTIRVDLDPLVSMGEALRSHISNIDREMRTMATSIPACARFQTIPGVGTITALSFYSAVGDPYRFKNNRDVGPYLGLTPNLYQSGVTARRGRISRYGNKLTRSHLITAATVLLRTIKTESSLRTWGLQLATKIGFLKARVAVARKLAVIMMAMWKTSTTFHPDESRPRLLHPEQAGLDPVRISGSTIPL
jgi:Transposase and inactivated derivatives